MSGGVEDRANAGQVSYGDVMSELEECLKDSQVIAKKALEQRDALAVALRSCEYEIFACLRDDQVKTNPCVLSALQTAWDAAHAALATLGK